MPSATVFNVQGYSIHDGPGIRTTVFLKGCPLRCLWCQNPESQQRRPELFFDADRCTGCGRCVPACPAGAVSLRDARSHTDRTRCDGAGRCAAACPAGARSLAGREMSVDEVFDAVAADRPFYRQSGGGVTVSGGEPLAQPRFVAELLRRCRDDGMHTALDTCGHAAWSSAAPVFAQADLVLYDFKHMDTVRHQRLTGAPNGLILDNARRLHHELGKPIAARVPLIPGCNDDAANLEATARFIAEQLSRQVPVHLNAYHRFGQGKHRQLQRPGAAFSAPLPDAAQLDAARRGFEAFGLTVHIGGS